MSDRSRSIASSSSQSWDETAFKERWTVSLLNDLLICTLHWHCMAVFRKQHSTISSMEANFQWSGQCETVIT